MSKTISLELDDKLSRTLGEVSQRAGIKDEDFVLDALKKQLSITLFEEARKELVPQAKAMGIHTDEDVFREFSRKPA